MANRSSARADRYRPVDQPGPPSRLRTVASGYDLTQLPLHLPPHAEESVVSWLRRLSVRYDVPARNLIRAAGSRKPVTTTAQVVARLRNNPALTAQLGLTDAEARALRQPKPLTAATTTYLATLHPGAPVRWQSRYCPQCLTGADPWWPDHWQTPLSLICLTHHTYLLTVCPSCGRPPHADSAWLARPTELHHCPSRLPARPGAGRTASWCDHDLTAANAADAPADQVQAQARLHQWAPGPAEATIGCGIPITHRIGFQPLAELVDAALDDSAVDAFDLRTDPVHVGPALVPALDVLDQLTLDDAAGAAWMLTHDGAHAPIGPVSRITNHHYNPLLGAVALAGVRDQLTPSHQLTFRTGHRAPRYPATTTPRNRRRLRLPDHRPHWPEPNPAWIPQALWSNGLPGVGVGDHDRTLDRTTLAMALARTGTTRDWTEICADLHLPATHADRIERLLADIQRNSTWPAILTGLERLMTALQRHPPPVNYQQRRHLGDDLDLITAAVTVGLKRHRVPDPLDTLVQHFWERFTGGDIAYAPQPIRIDTAGAAYRTFRQSSSFISEELVDVAYQHVHLVTHADGPLHWTPTV